MSSRTPIRWARLRRCAVIALCVAASTTPLLAGCAPPPEHAVEMVRSEVVILQDKTVFQFIEIFQINVYSALAAGGAGVTCADFPSRYKVGDNRLRTLAPQLSTINNWRNPPRPARLSPIVVPAGERMVVVVGGLTRMGDKGAFTLARGCGDNLLFKEGVSYDLNIDVKATSGAPCLQAGDCEPGLQCQSGAQSFPGGYCAVAPCSADTQCPPATRCVGSAGASLCARACDNIGDCNAGLPQTHDCQTRTGPTAGGCAKVCVYPLWNATTKCGG